jgi:GT2 family glycosyltransferase
MAMRRRALHGTGPFDESIRGRGEEEDWQRRYTARGGVVRYIAGAGLIHRRSAADATLPRLARAAYAQGQTARSWDVRKGGPPGPGAELRTLAGTVWHIGRRRCAIGVVMAAHSTGRVRALLSERGA